MSGKGGVGGQTGGAFAFALIFWFSGVKAKDTSPKESFGQGKRIENTDL